MMTITAIGGKAWWLAKEGDSTRPSQSLQYVGYEQSLEVLIKRVEDEKVNGIIGFSQGAAMAALLVSALPSDLQVDFGVYVAGFLPRDVEIQATITKACAEMQAVSSIEAYST